MNYRLVYENNKVYALHHSNGNTETLKNLLYFDKLEDCFDKIDELKLEYTYFSGDTIEIIFSGGTRTIKDNKDN
jgi:hypothetical protein